MPPKAGLKYWSWLMLATLVCQELAQVATAKKERKKPKEPNQYTEPFNATLSNSEELHEHPKVGTQPKRLRQTWSSGRVLPTIYTQIHFTYDQTADVRLPSRQGMMEESQTVFFTTGSVCRNRTTQPRRASRKPEKIPQEAKATEKTTEMLESPDPRITDPRRTWISFVHRPDDGSNSKKKCQRRDKKLRGLPGPPGPPGPPGAPGAEVTQEVLLQEFKEMLKEATERRASLALPPPPSEAPHLVLSLEEVSPYKRVEEAFHCKLKGQIVVDKKTLSELQNFQMPLAKGAFLRGSGLNLATGRFTAPVSGIYQFSANIHIDHSELKSKLQLRARDNIRVLICIESLCHRYTSLEVIAGLESNSKIFTVYVHGLLQLQAGQYTSIFVDNGAGAPVTIQNGSDFMGMLVGI